MVKVTCLLAKAGSGVGLSFGVRALTQMEIRCVKGMLRLKLISSEKNSVFKGLTRMQSPEAVPNIKIDNFYAFMHAKTTSKIITAHNFRYI